MNCWKFVKFVNIFPHQNFAPYGIASTHDNHVHTYMHDICIMYSYNNYESFGTDK